MTRRCTHVLPAGCFALVDGRVQVGDGRGDGGGPGAAVARPGGQLQQADGLLRRGGHGPQGGVLGDVAHLVIRRVLARARHGAPTATQHRNLRNRSVD